LLLVGLGEVFFNLAIRMLLLVPAFLVFGVAFHPTILLAPLTVVGMVLLGTAFGLLIMPLGSLYQDVGRFTAIMLPFWMILTPTVYAPFDSYPGSLLNWLNPASPLLLLSRDWLLDGSMDFLFVGLIYGALVLPLLLLGLIVYRISIPVLITPAPIRTTLSSTWSTFGRSIAVNSNAQCGTGLKTLVAK
jgi:lipopolysaccharide transport system permease protein